MFLTLRICAYLSAQPVTLSAVDDDDGWLLKCDWVKPVVTQLGTDCSISIRRP